METTKFAVLGFGGAGRAHAQRLQAMKGAEVKVIYDPKMPALGQAIRNYPDIHFTDKLDNVFLGEVDAVSICTPDHTHFEYAKLAVQNKLHTLVEKPMFVTQKQCVEMEKILEDNKVVFGVHHQMRYIPTFRGAYELVRKGMLGEILTIEADYIHDMRHRSFAFDDWRIDRENPQNIVLGGLSHAIDLMRWIVGEDVEETFSFAGQKGWREYPDIDTVIALMRFKSGTLGKGTMTISSAGPQRNTLAIYGTHGQIHNNIFRDADGAISFIRKPDLSFKQNIFIKFITPFLKQSPSILRDYPFSIYEHDSACQELLLDFVSAIRTGDQFPIGFDEGSKTVQLCLRVIEAYKNH